MFATSSILAAAVLLGAGGELPRDPIVERAPNAARDTISQPGLAAPAAAGASIPSGTGADSWATQAEAALGALAGRVQRLSHPDALRLAFRAYYHFEALNPGQVRKPYLYFVDYGLESDEPRGYVFDMEALTVVDGPFTVAHGRGSDRDGDGLPTLFSNRPGSEATSLGLFATQETYTFRGTSGGRPYRSIGLRLLGLSGRFNSAAHARGVVVHGAPYVTPGGAGRSEGCPAVEEDRAQRLIPMIAQGSLVYLFSPRDAGWMRGEPWAHGGTGTPAPPN